jgi:serine/threonine protein kinase
MMHYKRFEYWVNWIIRMLVQLPFLPGISWSQIIRLLGYKYNLDLHEHHTKLPFLPISLSEILDHDLHSDLIRSTIFQLLLAIAHMHDRGIAHRDINPRNIMIDWDGTIKIIDFGLAWTGGDQNGEEKAWEETKEDMICDVGTGYDHPQSKADD